MSSHNTLLNQTTLTPNYTRANGEELLDSKTTFILLKVFMCGVTPTIALLGVIGNFFSMLVLRKQGLKSCSNILLFCLAISDILYLIGYNSVPKIIYTIHGNESFQFSKQVSTVLFILYEIFLTIDYTFGYTSQTLPMLITMERLVAVFLPLKFTTIITPKRTVTAVLIVVLFWFTNFIYTAFWLVHTYKLDASQNTTVGCIERSALYAQHRNAVPIFEEVWAFMGLRIPPAFTCIGCFLIGIRIKIISSRRKKLSSKAPETSMVRMTKMLLAVCVLYTIMCAVVALRPIIPGLVSYLLTDDGPSNFSRVFYILMNTLACVNSSWNFCIYVLLNKNFRDTYKSLFAGCCRTQ